MTTALALLGLFAGALAPWAAAWLLFVYPYAGVSLRPFWYGLGAGLVVGVLSLIAVLAAFAAAWPKD